MMMALQEHSLYDDSPHVYSKSMNNSMYLDLKQNKAPILNTPDVSVFALSTPEVHSLLSNAGSNSTSITSAHLSPSNLIRNQEPVTMEQEFYARGFLDRFEALQARELISKNAGASYTSTYATGPNPTLEAVAPTYVTATLDHIPTFGTATQTTSETTSSYPVASQHDGYYTTEGYSIPFRHESAMMAGYPMLTTGNVSVQPMYNVMDTHINNNALKEMSMVPDMHTQEQMKIERKKARNRIAASKCRSRRLQREADLESKVRILKDHNKELNSEVNGLKDQISNLRKALMQHVKTGCQIELSSIGSVGIATTNPSSFS
jgi:hypothetical protein